MFKNLTFFFSLVISCHTMLFGSTLQEDTTIIENNVIYTITDNIPSSPQQDIFDGKHSYQFAEYLFYRGDFQQAVFEFERVLFMDDTHSDAAGMLVRALRENGNYNRAVNEIINRFGEPESLKEGMLSELIALKVMLGEFDIAKEYLHNNLNISGDNRLELELQVELLAGNWKEAKSIYAQNTFDNDRLQMRFDLLMSEVDQVKFKSPAIALGLSAIVPGLGKVYAGAWKDGIVSFLFVGGTAFNAYRGFVQNGITSTHGWVFTALTTGFYTGNLYGSWRAAQKTNQIQEHKIKHHVQNFGWLNR